MTRVIRGKLEDIDWLAECGLGEVACEENGCRVVGDRSEMVTDGNAWFCPKHGAVIEEA